MCSDYKSTVECLEATIAVGACFVLNLTTLGRELWQKQCSNHYSRRVLDIFVRSVEIAPKDSYCKPKHCCTANFYNILYALKDESF